uniref:Uncharacterized protein n=1 Tax=Aegilops tauschii subsp. strangulata TaxID=200361 RepID=A0A453LVA3_AEGTS
MLLHNWFPVPLKGYPSFSVSSDPQRRPSFQELLERLQDLQKQYVVQARTRREAAGKGAGKMSPEDC